MQLAALRAGSVRTILNLNELAQSAGAAFQRLTVGTPGAKHGHENVGLNGVILKSTRMHEG